jgi:F-type H+-transporting ATPase subunit delta
MIATRIVRRYAAALFRAAQKAGLIDAVESDLGLVSFLFENSPDMWDAIRSPVVSPEKKHQVLRDVFAGKVQQITLDYLGLLVDKHREEVIAKTQGEYVDLANEARGLIEVDVTTAVDLDVDNETRLKGKLGQLTGKQVRLRRMVAPEIMGGVIVKIGDRVIDGSIRGRLAALRERLSE